MPKASNANRVFILADRNVLVDDPMAKNFSLFGRLPGAIRQKIAGDAGDALANKIRIAGYM